MTAARSDLMALADEIDRTKPYIVLHYPGPSSRGLGNAETKMIVSALRLSQPDREAIAERVYQAFPFEPRLGTPHKPAWIPGGNSLMQDEARRAADAILSLLSGAGTKSDGGGFSRNQVIPHDVVGVKMTEDGMMFQTRNGGLRKPTDDERVGMRPSDPSPGPDVSLSAPVGEPFGYFYVVDGQDDYGTFTKVRRGEYMRNDPWTEIAVYTRLPAPAVGPDVREALEIIAANDGNADQAVAKRALELIDNLSALTRPLGGFVQGSIATKQSSDSEGSSRTETAGGEA